MSEQPRRNAARDTIGRVVQPVVETRELLLRDGEMKPGLGRISGVIALSLGFLCLLAVFVGLLIWLLPRLLRLAATPFRRLAWRRQRP